MTESAPKMPSPTQILAARVAMKAARMLERPVPDDIKAMAELPLPSEMSRPV